MVDNEEQDSAHHRSSSSVVSPSHLYLASNLQCSVKPTTTQIPVSFFYFSLCSLIATTVRSMTCFGGMGCWTEDWFYRPFKPPPVPNSHGREASLPGARFCESEVLTKALLHNRGHSWQEEACARGRKLCLNCDEGELQLFSSLLALPWSDFLVEPSLECMSWYELPGRVMDNSDEPTNPLLLLTALLRVQRHSCPMLF